MRLHSFLAVLHSAYRQLAMQTRPSFVGLPPVLNASAFHPRALRGTASPRRPRSPLFTACANNARVQTTLGLPQQQIPQRQASMTAAKDLPDINEEDLEEQFIRGSGPGGQKINKTACCVLLKHKPSGITVKCQETRSQMKNRELARKILRRKLDEIARGEESLAARELSRARARKARRRRKAVKKHFKSRMDKAMMNDWS